MGCIFRVDIWQNSQLTRERLEWGWPVQLILEERFLAWLALVMIFTCPDNMESQRALESLKSLGGFGCYCFNTDLIWWGTVVEEIDPDNKHCPYKRWLKFEDYIFGGWWFLIGYVELCGSIYPKIEHPFCSKEFQFRCFGNLKLNWPLFFGGRPPAAVSYNQGKKLMTSFCQTPLTKRIGFDINRDMFFEM